MDASRNNDATHVQVQVQVTQVQQFHEIDCERSREKDPAPPSVPDFGFVRTLPGMTMLINIVLLFLSWVIIIAWSNDVLLAYTISGSVNFFRWSTTFPFACLIVVTILMILAVPKRTKIINFPFSLMLCCGFWVIFLFLSSIILASKARKYSCSDWNCGSVGAVAAFGFFSTGGLAFQGFLHFREFRDSGEDWKKAGFIVCC